MWQAPDHLVKICRPPNAFRDPRSSSVGDNPAPNPFVNKSKPSITRAMLPPGARTPLEIGLPDLGKRSAFPVYNSLRQHIVADVKLPPLVPSSVAAANAWNARNTR
eukprot:1186076-Prorocentrum_minimum.AAC.2